MAGSISQAALRSKWGDLVETGTSTLPEPTDVSKGLKNVVGWLKQASIEVREAGKRAVTQIQSNSTNLQKTTNLSSQNDINKSGINSTMMTTNLNNNNTLSILHFNDVYNIEPNSSEPVGGAARFCTAIKSFQNLQPLVLFSGDAFSPSMLSTFTKGEQMISVLNAFGTHCAVFGNHEFDHGLEVLSEHITKTNFPWLMSNVVDNETGRPLGGGKITHFILHNELRIGLIGLVEREWLETITTIDPKEITYIDFIKAGNQLSDELLNEGCDLVIALTHMRTPNDIELAKHCPKIDIILGGHDHVFEVNTINGTKVIKSGTDFRQFSKITIERERNDLGKLQVNVEAIDVTAEYLEDEPLKIELDKYSEIIESKMGEVLGTFCVELDGRFSQIRTMETNLGDWVCDVLLATTGADITMINSGTFRSDKIHPPGPFTMKDLVRVVPMRDPLVVLEVSGSVILAALENSVSTYPKLEGRFPQVSGVAFAFDPSKPAMSRVNVELVQVADEWLNIEQTYTMCIKTYMYGGYDGFTMFKDCKVIMDDDTCPELGLAIQNHFKAIDVRIGKAKHSKHRQSLVTLSRRHSMIQMLENMDLDGPTPIRRTSLTNQARSTDLSHNKAKLCRRASIDDLEQESCLLSPIIQHRIICIQNDEHLQRLLTRKATLQNDTVIKEVDDC